MVSVVFIIPNCILLDAVKVKAEPKKAKDTKPQTKPQSKGSAKKTLNRQIVSKKEKNGVSSAADPCPPEPVESRAVAPSSKEAAPQLGSICSPAHKLFQRTLSPADVLHVHSYAKGDYGEADAPPKQDMKSEDSDDESEKDNRHVRKAVSGNGHYTHYNTVNGPSLLFIFFCIFQPVNN